MTPEQLDFEKTKVKEADIAWAKTGETMDLDAQMKLYPDEQVPEMIPPNGTKIIVRKY